MQLLHLLLISLVFCGLSRSQGLSNCTLGPGPCGNGWVNSNEECDDSNTVSGDGCSADCMEETGFSCSTNDNCTSTCDFVYLLDLDISDGSSNLNQPTDRILNSTTEYLIDIDRHQFSFAVINNTLWSNISVVILTNADGSNNGESIDLQIQNAILDGRLDDSSLVNDVVSNGIDVTSDQAAILQGFLNGASIYRGKIYSPVTDAVNPFNFVNATLRSLRYIYDDTSNFVPRNVCIVAQSGNYHSVACINIIFEGTNANPPSLIYSLTAEAARFTEGQSTPSHIFTEDLQVTDPDHPKFLMEEATITILAAQEQFETLSVSGTFDSFNERYDPVTGRLTISGNANTTEYRQILESVVYNNSDDEPSRLTQVRTIRIDLFDGKFTGSLEIELLLINRDDVPTILFSQENITTYYEGNGSVLVDPMLHVVDIDPDEMIQRVDIDLLQAMDGSNETINVVSTYSEINVALTQEHRLELSGNATPTMYQETLRRLRYEHTDSNPGNPTTGTRVIQFFIEDDASFSRTLNISFNIYPINDAPEMSFTGLSLTKTLRYNEDDPLLPLANDLYLLDVDSNIDTATFHFTGLLNGLNDFFYINETLASLYGISISTTYGASSRSIIASGSATSTQYRQVLQTLAYRNLLQNNSVSNGIRTVTFKVNDTFGLESSVLTVSLEVSERNDEPDVTVDEILNFTEGSTSVLIATSHLISIMDEEFDNISSINITLTAINGELDGREFIFDIYTDNSLLDKAIRTPHSLYISCEGTVDEYKEVLKLIYYANEEAEPTYYVNVTSMEKLQRQIVIELVDNNATHPSTATHRIAINLTLINDNRPVISFRLKNSSCLASYPGSVSKRDVRFIASHPQKKLQIKRRMNSIMGLAPSVTRAYSQFSSLIENITCLSNITIVFSTNTTTPIVEVKRDLQDILSMSPNEVNVLPHYGKWLNRRTLIVNFMGCYQSIDSEIHVIFRSQKDNCNASTPCTSGICFSNKTGCPLIGIHHIAPNTTTHIDNATVPQTALLPAHQRYPLLPYFVLCVLVGLAFVLLIAGVKLMYSTDKQTQKSSKNVPQHKNVLKIEPKDKKCPETLQPTKSTSLLATEATIQRKGETVETSVTESTTTNTPTTVQACAAVTPDTKVQKREGLPVPEMSSKRHTQKSQQVVASQSHVHHKDINSSNNHQLVALPAEH